MTDRRAPRRRTLTESYANMPADVVRIEPLLEWMHEHWGCTCEEVQVVIAHHADGTGGLRIIHEIGCAVVRERAVACN